MDGRKEQIASLIEEAEREAYARGWRDAIAALQASAPPAPSGVVISLSGKVPIVDRKRGRPAKAVDLVRDMISSSPGMKGADIARSLDAKGTPVLERTVRSCLRRLRQAKAITQRNGKWYPRPKDAVPENTNGEALGPPPR